MLALVVADRDDVGLVEQDVAGHQDRVGEEAGGDELLPLALFLELRHPAELAVARDRAEQPGRLGVRLHVALAEHRRALRVESRREEHRREIERPLVEVLRVVLDGDRVQVDDAEERLALLLRRRVLAEAADQVAELLRAGGLDPAEDAHASHLGATALRPTSTLARWPSPRKPGRLPRGAAARRAISPSGRTRRARKPHSRS